MKKIFAPIILLIGVILFAAGLSYLHIDNEAALFSAFVGAALILFAFYLFRFSRRGSKKNSRDEILDKVRARVQSQYENDDDERKD